ncbi:MAG: OstA-like protein [Candidatus Izemoplasmatales bacterium]
MTKTIKYILFLFWIAFSLNSFSQSKTQIQLVRAERLDYDEGVMKGVKRIIGDVVFEHDGAFLYCDSAWLYESNNSVDTYGEILIQVNDSVSITGEFMHYDGNTRMANIERDVVMKDKTSTLTSDKIIYDRNTNEAFYNTGGVLKDAENTLTSIIGIYQTSTKKVFFKEDVVLVNERYRLECDTLVYHTSTEIAYFPSATVGISDENYMYCEDGWYETKTDITMLKNNAFLSNKNQSIKADSIYFDQKQKYGYAWLNVVLRDSVQDLFMLGDYCHYDDLNGFTYMTDKAEARMVENMDTLYIHADTLKMLFDSTQTAQLLTAYYHCFFYRDDIQGYADSLAYNAVDSVIYLYRNPVLWSEDNQLKADTITLFLKNGQFDEVHLSNLAFISNELEFQRYNQVKGKRMLGYFNENKLFKIDVLGNAESLYYIEEDNGALIGVNKTESAFMTMLLDKNAFTNITVSGKPKAKMSPWENVSEEDKKLLNFVWLIQFRPFSREDIFELHAKKKKSEEKVTE